MTGPERSVLDVVRAVVANLKSSDPRKPETLMPAPPGRRSAWGRLKRILSEFSTAPLEIAMGVASMFRGSWTLLPYLINREEHWLTHQRLAIQGAEPIWEWGVCVLVLGFLQLWSCLYRYDLIRTLAAFASLGTNIYLFMLYIFFAPDSIAVPMYFAVGLMQLWIGLRGWLGGTRNGMLEP